jgi:hypothetical protein
MLIRRKRNIDWTGKRRPDSLPPMAATDKTAMNEAELEALIAKYTLEYLYRWTNEFDPKELGELRKLLASASPEHIFGMMKTGRRTLPN